VVLSKLDRATEISGLLEEIIASGAAKYRVHISISLQNSWDEGPSRVDLAVPSDLVETIIVATNEVAKARLADLQASRPVDVALAPPSRTAAMLRYARSFLSKASATNEEAK
jgi:hypothetical protein